MEIIMEHIAEDLQKLSQRIFDRQGNLRGQPIDPSRRSATRRPDLPLPQLCQLVAYILCVDPEYVPNIGRGWLAKRQQVIEHWCDSMMRRNGQGPRGSEHESASPFPALRVTNPALPTELTYLASYGADRRRRTA